MHIEDWIFSEMLPVNTLALLERMKQIVKEGKTNSLYTGTHRRNEDLQLKIRKAFWLLAEMMLHVIPPEEKSWKILCDFVSKEWNRLYKLEENRKATEKVIELLAHF